MSIYDVALADGRHKEVLAVTGQEAVRQLYLDPVPVVAVAFIREVRD